MNKDQASIQERFDRWHQTNLKFDARAKQLAKTHPLKSFKTLPKMPAMTRQTRKFFRLKALIYLLRHDKGKQLISELIQNPLLYLKRYFRSLFRALRSNKGKSFLRDGDFFFYGLKNEEEWKKNALDPNKILLLGFSYCHKPHECPSGRFTDQCATDESSPVCNQCFIAKMIRATTGIKKLEIVIIPTVHAIGHSVFRLQKKYPDKRLLFLITACEMTLEMFADWGNMVGLEGIGVRLDGRICNTMRAFELSEKGIKPGLTLVLERTQERMVSLITHLIK